MDAAPVVSAACMSAREARKKATNLEHGGHEVLALAKIDEANAACRTERSSSAALEAQLLVGTNNCARARELAPKDVQATCDAREAPSKGTEQTMRAKMREAYVAEQTKDYAHANALYLEAWAEHHPEPAGARGRPRAWRASRVTSRSRVAFAIVR